MIVVRRSFEDEKKAKMGVLECAKHELVEPYHVLWERDGECRRSSAPSASRSSSVIEAGRGVMTSVHFQMRLPQSIPPPAPNSRSVRWD